MKRLRIIGLALLALFALGAVAASAASAVEGFLPLSVKTVTVLSGVAILETHSKEQIKCTKTTGSGTFTNDNTGTGKLDFEGCALAGFADSSLGDASGIILANVNIKICLINSAALTFGIAVTPSEEIHIEAPALPGVLINVSGTVIGELLTKGPAELFVVDFAGKEGLGNVASCTIEGKTEKHSLKSKKNAEAAQEASENTKGGLLQFKEKEELMDT